MNKYLAQLKNHYPCVLSLDGIKFEQGASKPEVRALDEAGGEIEEAL